MKSLKDHLKFSEASQAYYITWEGQGLFDEDLTQIIGEIPDKTKIQEICLAENNLGDECADSLCQLTSLKTLKIAKNNFTTKAVRAIVEACPKLTTVDISSNPLQCFGFSDDDEKWLLEKASKINFKLDRTGLSAELCERVRKAYQEAHSTQFGPSNSHTLMSSSSKTKERCPSSPESPIQKHVDKSPPIPVKH